jgi:hypothetical protein
MLNYLLLVTLSLGSSTLFASPAAPEHCFTKHLSDATQLNTERRPLYEARSNGKSVPLSELLMASERIGLLTAAPLEALEWPLRADGINVLCEDLVPMSLTPAFPSTLTPPTEQSYDPAATESVHQDLLSAWHDGGYPQLLRTSEDWLRNLEGAGPYHCMVHHLLESVARAAALAPGQVERADVHGKGVLATAIIHAFIYEQIEFIQLGRHFDNMAAPLQAEGLPIICGDVPPISVPTT